MKISLYLSFGMIMTFCSCILEPPPPEFIVYPDKKLEGILIKGRYDKSNSEKPFEQLKESFCYDKITDKDAVFDKNLKARLYDKAGNLLAEDFIRSDDTDRKKPIFRVYFTYHDNSEIRLVKLEDGKEITFYTTLLTTESRLKEYVGKYINRSPHTIRSHGLIYDTKSECFLTLNPLSNRERQHKI